MKLIKKNKYRNDRLEDDQHINEGIRKTGK